VVLEGPGSLVRRNWAVHLTLLAVAIVGAIVWFEGNVLGAAGVLVGVTCGPVFLSRNAFPRLVPASFRATREAIHIQGIGEVRSDDLLEAKLLPRGHWNAELELRTRTHGTFRYQTAPGLAAALLDRLGVRRARFSLTLPPGTRVAIAVVVGASFGGVVDALVGHHVSAILSLFLATAAVLVLLAVIRGSLVVDSQLLTVRWPWRTRVIPLADVASVTASPRFGTPGVDDVRIALRSGETLEIAPIDRGNTGHEVGAESRAVYLHVKVALEHVARSTVVQSSASSSASMRSS